jgi:hypothetical protein
MPEISVFLRFYMPYIHEFVVERLISLRECCGGFGFMQISGHPGFMERACIRAAQPALTTIPDNKEIMKRLHYYSSDLSRVSSYIKEISAEGNTVSDIFCYFIFICMGMSQSKHKLDEKQYMREFLKQAIIQIAYSTTYYDPIDLSSPSENILPYIIVRYVVNNFKYVEPSLIKMEA